MLPPLAVERIGLWVAVAVSAVAFGAIIALAQGRRTRAVLAGTALGALALGVLVYFGYFLLFSGD